jgi:hypothetical protein
VLEAERYDARIARGGRSWEPRTDVSGFAGSAAVVATPDKGASINTGYASQSAELQYRVRFATPGTYHVWLRGYGVSKGNSLHVGLDGAAVNTADRANFPMLNKWAWSKATLDGPVATLVVAAAGDHIVNVWMREDRVRLDRLLLTTSSTLVPSGTGPAESTRSDVTPPPPPAASYLEQNGLLVLEAERYDARIARSGKSWESRTDVTGFAGSAAMVATPDNGASTNTGYASQSAELQYRVRFAMPGTYYVWLRGYGISNGNSLHLGLDGAAVSTRRPRKLSDTPQVGLE